MKSLACLVVLSGFFVSLGASAAGAIAIDEDVTNVKASYSVTVGALSNEQAGRQALAGCGSLGNKACQVAVRFETCGAYAASPTNYGTGFGRTSAAAQAMAMNVCGHSACQVVVAKCD